MSAMLQELRLACRVLSRRWLFAVSTILILSVAIAAGIVVHSVVYAVLFRPYPFPDPDTVVLVYARDLSLTATAAAQRGSAGAHEIGLSLPDLDDLKRASTTLSGFVPMTPFAANLTGRGDPVRVHGASVGPDFFSVLGVAMALGSGFSEADDANGGHRAVVLTHAFWARHMGSDRNVVGGDLLLDGAAHRIAGILPETFESLTGEAHELFRAVRPPAASAQRAVRFWPAVARVKGVDIDAARAELDTLAADLARQYPETNRNIGTAVHTLRELTPDHLRTALLFLLGAVVLVIVVTCANLANLQIADSTGRLRETAIRVTLGASSWRLLRQAATEGMVLATAGGLGGTLMSFWALELMKGFAPALPRLDRAAVDARALAGAGIAVLLVGLALGLAPWSQAARSASEGQLGMRVIGDRRRSGAMNAIVIAQIAVAVLLVGAAGLMLRSLQRLSQVDPGFRAGDVLTFHIPLSSSQMIPQRSAARFSALRARLSSVPGVTAAGATLQLPLSGLDVDLTQLEVGGAPPAAPEHEPAVRLHVITPDYFVAMGVPLRRGRHLSDADAAGVPGVAVINEAMARRLWPNQDPIGRQVTQRLTFTPGEDPARTIVGIVGNVKHFGLHVADEPQMYVPHAQSPWPAMSFAVRSPVAVAQLVPSLRAGVAEVDPSLPMDDIRTMTEIVGSATGEPRFRTAIVTTYAAACTLMAFLGLYAVLAHSVSQRTREIGVRVAVGATPAEIQRMVLAEGGRAALAGVVIGFLALVGTVRLINALLFGVSLFEPAALLGSAAMCTACTAIACAVPAYRAARVDAVIALRGD